MNIRPFAKTLAQRPRTILLLFTIFTITIGLFIPNVYMTSDLTKFLPENEPEIINWNRIAKEFKIGDTIIIYVEVEHIAGGIRDPEVMKEIDRVCSNPNLNKQENDEGKNDGILKIRSISNLIKEENAKPLPTHPFGGTGNKEIPGDRNLIYTYMARPSIQSMDGVLFTNEYDVAVIIIQLAAGADYDDVLERTKDAIDHRGTSLTDMTITGTVAMQKAIQTNSMSNLLIIFPIAIILVSAVLFFFHRDLKGIIIAFLPPAFALILTFGTLGIFAPELTLISISVVALLIGLGVDYSIHLMNRFTEEKLLQDKINKMETTLKSTGKAVLLSTVTTMIGFGSLMISSMSPMVSFGFACAIGILYCFVSSIILVPCLVLILKFERTEKVLRWKQFANFAVNNRKRILIIAIFFAFMSLVILPSIKTDVNYFDLAPEGISEIEKLQLYSEKFGGGSNLNALYLQTAPQGLTNPETLKTIKEIEQKIMDEVKKISDIDIEVYSVVDELKDINDILNKNEISKRFSEFMELNEILFDRIASEGIIDEDYSKTMIIVSIPIGKSIEELDVVVNRINEIVDETELPYGGYISHVTGQDAINVAINKKLADEQTRSMIIALLLVLAVLIIIFNSSLYGFLTMIPVGFVLIWEPGFLVVLDIPLSVVTISIASIMIGIGIDYGVHITHRVREEMKKGLSNVDATKVAIEKTGLSLVEAALTTVAGLVSIYFARIPALQEFGLVIILMTSLSFIAAVLILPAFYHNKYIK